MTLTDKTAAYVSQISGLCAKCQKDDANKTQKLDSRVSLVLYAEMSQIQAGYWCTI